jgi:hypothetical protein
MGKIFVISVVSRRQSKTLINNTALEAGGSAINAAKNKKYFFLVDIKIHAANSTNEVLILRGLSV